MVRIALISDIHFGQFSRTSEFSVPGEPIKDETLGGESLKSSLISVLKEASVQYLCIAGDLTSVGSPQEFIFCEQEILSIAKEAGIAQEHIILGLGNHDVDWKISNISESYKPFESDFPYKLVQEKYRKIAASASLINIKNIQQPNQCGPAPFSGIVEDEELIFFVLNSGWCCTQEQALSHGKLDTDQLEWFEENAIKYKDDKRWKIVLMHHHPFSYSYHVPVFDISMLEEGSRFIEISGQNGIQLVLHGHRHHPKAETHFRTGWDHPITFICAGSLTANSEHRSNGFIPNTIHIIELTDEIGVLKLLNYQFSLAEGWIPIKDYCPETPLDSTMLLGKYFNSEQINQSIKELVAEKELLWDDLDESLRFIPVNDLNSRIKKQLTDKYTIIGKFPNEVFLIKK